MQGLYRELIQEQEAALDADDSLDQLEQPAPRSISLSASWEKRTPQGLSTLRRALSGKQRPESGDVLHALQVLQERGYGVLEPMEYRGQQGWKYTASKPLLTAN